MSKVTLQRGLVDTKLLLDIFNAELEATQFAIDLLQLGRIQLSEFSALVALTSARDATEYAEREAFFPRNTVHSLTARIVRRAWTLLSALSVPSPISADDALVAATAIEHSLPLYTLDPARFAAVPGLTTAQPY